MKTLFLQITKYFVLSKEKISLNRIIVTIVSVFVGMVLLISAFLQYVLEKPLEILGNYFSEDEMIVVERFRLEESEVEDSTLPFCTGELEYLMHDSAHRLINEGYKHIGKPYVWAAFGPKSFDCSGYVAYCLRQSGVQNVPARPTCRTLWENDVVKIHPEEKRPGDLIFFAGTQPIVGASHIGIYIGGNKYLEANSEAGVKVSSILSNWSKKHFYGYGRPKSLIQDKKER